MLLPHRQCKLIVHDVLMPKRLPRVLRNWLGKDQLSHYPTLVERLRQLEGFDTTLAVVASGIQDAPFEVINYLRSRTEWSFQCHGLYHRRYDALDRDRCREELAQAADIIADVFGERPSEYIPPYNQYNEMTGEVATELGMRQIAHYRHPSKAAMCYATHEQLDVHWWKPYQMQMASACVKFHQMTEPIIIVGAPRSGTTALMRWMASEHPYCLALKEHERHWREKRLILRWYYARQLANRPHMSVIDKNVRNSKRILQIAREFPDARFIHIIRDGRAAISSWRDWAIRTKKKDTSIAGAARQWRDYVSFILKNRRKLKHYVELRYEDLCNEEPYFTSRNAKWRQRLTASELQVIDEIAGPLLRRLGYDD